MSATIVTGDITTLDVEAIVNAANMALAGGGGVDGAIHRAAGSRELLEACRPLAPCPTGDARITPGFKLRAKWIIHAVGPAWEGGHRRERELLASCYRRSLALAQEVGAASVAFPAISTGIYRFPMKLACDIAARTVRDELAAGRYGGRVVFCMFDERATESMRAALGV
jgi:O-acetyl-ADP-ribose deacetylase (regulator of RNase III)